MAKENKSKFIKTHVQGINKLNNVNKTKEKNKDNKNKKR